MRRPDGNGRSARPRREIAEANLTPMIDVVFLLIVFFLVSSHLARRESRLALDLPEATTGQPDTDPSPRLTINVQRDGSLLLGSTPVTPPELVQRLSARQSQANTPLRVRLRGDQRAPYSAVEPALAACARAGLEDISLAVFADRGP